jgi:hypothetical protein
VKENRPSKPERFPFPPFNSKEEGGPTYPKTCGRNGHTRKKANTNKIPEHPAAVPGTSLKDAGTLLTQP